MSIRFKSIIFVLLSCCSAQTVVGQWDSKDRDPRQPIPNRAAYSPPNAGILESSTAQQQYLTLREAIYLALRQSDVVNVLDGEVRTASTTAYDAQIQSAKVYEQSGVFDPRFQIGYEGSQINRPPNSFFGPGIQERTRRDEGNFRTEIEQKFLAGTTVSAGYDPGLGYLFLPDGVSPGELNPAHSAVFELGLKKPLLRGAGSDANTAAIRIAKASEEQSIWDFQEVTNAQLRSVCESYWSLQAAYQRLRAIESVLPLAAESRRIERLRFESERTIYADLARSEVQLEELIRQRIRVLSLVRMRAYELNQLLGLSAAENVSYIPTDQPFEVPLHVDLSLVHQTAISRKPELMGLRKELDAESIGLQLAQNSALPELDLEAKYWTSGLGDRLDDALDQSTSLDYTSWTVGLNFSVPLGNRSARGRVQAKELELVRGQIELKRAEERVLFQINEIVTDISAVWQRYESSVRQREQAERWLKVSRIRYSNPPEAGTDRNWLLLALSDYQRAMQTLINTNTESAELLAEYNTLLARLDEAQGVSRDRWQVNLVEPSSTLLRNSLPQIVPGGQPALNHSGHVFPSDDRVQQSGYSPSNQSSHPNMIAPIPHRFSQRPLNPPPVRQTGHTFKSPTLDYRN